jgi:hypothetical protein
MLIRGAWTERVFQATRSDRLLAFYISPGFGHHFLIVFWEGSHLGKTTCKRESYRGCILLYAI